MIMPKARTILLVIILMLPVYILYVYKTAGDINPLLLPRAEVPAACGDTSPKTDSQKQADAPPAITEDKGERPPAQAQPPLPAATKQNPDPQESDLSAPAPAPATMGDAQQTLTQLLQELTWQEKLMVLKTLTKFTPHEMLDAFRLFRDGSHESYRHLDALVMGKVSEAEFEKLRVLVAKYR